MEELIEKMRVVFLEKDQIIKSQESEIWNTKNQISDLNNQIASLQGQVIEANSKLKKFKELLKGVDSE